MNYYEPHHILNCVRCHPEDFQIGVAVAIAIFVAGACIGAVVASLFRRY